MSLRREERMEKKKICKNLFGFFFLFNCPVHLNVSITITGSEYLIIVRIFIVHVYFHLLQRYAEISLQKRGKLKTILVRNRIILSTVDVLSP